jgi:hypothetical protein
MKYKGWRGEILVVQVSKLIPFFAVFEKPL